MPAVLPLVGVAVEKVIRDRYIQGFVEPEARFYDGL